MYSLNCEGYNMFEVSLFGITYIVFWMLKTWNRSNGIITWIAAGSCRQKAIKDNQGNL